MGQKCQNQYKNLTLDVAISQLDVEICKIQILGNSLVAFQCHWQLVILNLLIKHIEKEKKTLQHNEAFYQIDGKYWAICYLGRFMYNFT